MIGQGLEMASIVPTLGLFAAAAFRLIPSVNRVLSACNPALWSSGVNHLHEEIKLTALEPSASQGKGADHAPHPFQTEIRLSSISYAYPARRWQHSTG